MNNLKMRVMIKLKRTSAPRVTARIGSILCSKLDNGLEPLKSENDAEMNIPVPNIIYIKAGR